MASATPKPKTCCPPAIEKRTGFNTRMYAGKGFQALFDLSEIPGGQAFVGTDQPYIAVDEEGPCRIQHIKPFKMMKTTVTNAMFRKFIDETNYKTDAQRFGWSFVFEHQMIKSGRDNPDKKLQSTVGAEWWHKVSGACWNRICGSDANSPAPDDHPVVHVSWNDAKAFAAWAGGRLPTEAEWEHAARGGLQDVMFPWGNREPDDNSFQPCNIWQGQFPNVNSCVDGYAATAPARSYSPNNYGLYSMCGNVWEWTSGRFKLNGRSSESKHYAKHFKNTKILKGGSFLCHKSYCFRYRIAARTGSTPDSTTTHQGFRLVFD